jgi:hypothetical protein
VSLELAVKRFDENLHPRDRRGRFTNKVGLPKLNLPEIEAPTGPPERKPLSEVLADVDRASAHAEVALGLPPMIATPVARAQRVVARAQELAKLLGERFKEVCLRAIQQLDLLDSLEVTNARTWAEQPEDFYALADYVVRHGPDIAHHLSPLAGEEKGPNRVASRTADVLYG